MTAFFWVIFSTSFLLRFRSKVKLECFLFGIAKCIFSGVEWKDFSK